MIEIVSLICARCNDEWDLTGRGISVLRMRELADGSICLACPNCGGELATCNPCPPRKEVPQ